MPDILITIKDGSGVVSGVTPAGQEWIEINCIHDKPSIEERHVLYLTLCIEMWMLDVEVIRWRPAADC